MGMHWDGSVHGYKEVHLGLAIHGDSSVAVYLRPVVTLSNTGVVSFPLPPIRRVAAWVPIHSPHTRSPPDTVCTPKAATRDAGFTPTLCGPYIFPTILHTLRFPTDPLRFPYDYPTIPYGFPTDSLRIPYGFPTDPLRFPYDSLRISYRFPTDLSPTVFLRGSYDPLHLRFITARRPYGGLRSTSLALFSASHRPFECLRRQWARVLKYLPALTPNRRHARHKKQHKNIGLAIGIFLGICKFFVDHGPFHI